MTEQPSFQTQRVSNVNSVNIQKCPLGAIPGSALPT